MNSFTNFFKDKNLRVGVLSSVIASFIFINIQNIFASLWSLFTKFSESIYSNFSDRVYSNASLGQRNWLDFLVFFLIINGMVLYVVRESFYLKLKTNRLLKKEKTNAKESNDINSEEKVKLERKSAFDLLKFIDRIILPILLFSVLIQIIITISYVFLSYADLQLNTSFNRRLNVLAPYITDQKVKIYKSKWAMMETRKDFQKINDEMEKDSKIAKIKLPENLLK